MLQIYPVLCRAGKMDNYAYIIQDTKTQTTAIIDPSETHPVIDKLQQLNLQPQAIINTHHHFDHVEGNQELATKYQIPIYCSEYDFNRTPAATGKLLPDQPFILGDSKAEIISAPGHTQGHILLYFAEDKALFTGDVLFNLCIGGLFEGTAEQMFATLQKIKSLPDDVSFYPGHEYTFGGAHQAFAYNHGNDDIQNYLQTARARLAKELPVAPITLGQEKSCNPYLQATTLQEFINL